MLVFQNITKYNYCKISSAIFHVIEFSDLVDLWVIEIKISPWSFAYVVGWDHMNRAWNADLAARTCERFVYSILQTTNFYEYHTLLTHLFEKFLTCSKVCGLFFSWLCFLGMISWAGKLRMDKVLICYDVILYFSAAVNPLLYGSRVFYEDLNHLCFCVMNDLVLFCVCC